MNQEDLAAEPMFDAFADHPDYTPFVALRNQTPLDNLVPSSPPSAAALPAQVRNVYREWERWSARQNFSRPDLVNAPQFNRVQWYATHGWRVPYPGDTHVLTPEVVPGAELPAGWLG
jgi:hypothetical protein